MSEMNQEALDAALAAYSEENLKMYDDWILGVNVSHWQCPTELLLEEYNKHISTDHLDVGVGTGYYLDLCTFPEDKETPRIAIMDMAEKSIAETSKRIERYSPEVIWGNVLEPLIYKGNKFSSIACNYLFHCVPGSFKEKGIAFKHLSEHLADEGVLFGATICRHGVDASDEAIEMMNGNNEAGFFNNLDDSVEDLTAALNDVFSNVEVTVKGSVAIFNASGKKS